MEEWIELHQVEGWHYFELSLSAVDMTADGQWIVAAANTEQNRNALSGVMAFYYEPSANAYNNFFPSNFGFYASNASCITDDHL